MKYAFYYPRGLSGNGGVSASLWSWVEALERDGHDCRIVVDPREPPFRVDTRAVALDHTGRGRFRRPRNLLPHISDVDGLILSSVWQPHNWWAASCARKAGIPYVVVPHGGYEPLLRSNTSWLRSPAVGAERYMLERSAFVHLFFESEISHLLAIAPKARTVIAPTGFDVSDVTSSWLGHGDEVVWIGRYDVRHKGLDLLLRSMETIMRRRRPRLVLHGRDSTNSVSDIRRLISKAGLDPWVQANGPIEAAAKSERLNSSVAYVHPSRWECHSMVLIEALARGIPSVVSSSISIADTLDKAGAALLAPSGTPEFGRALLAIDDGSVRKRLSTAARELVTHKFDWPTASKSFLEGWHR